MGLFLAWPRPPWPPDTGWPAQAVDLLPRLSWSRPAAERLWGERLGRMIEASLAVEIELVRRGDLNATVVAAPHGDLPALLERLAPLGLAAAPVQAGLDAGAVRANPDAGREALVYGVLVAQTARLAESLRVLTRGPSVEAALWFGYPECCAQAWSANLADGFGDPGAGWLANSAGTAGRRPPSWIGGLGLGPLRHGACGRDCAPSARLARRFLDLTAELGFAEEAGWLAEIDGWPRAASIAGGILEIKTPAFRYAYLVSGKTPVMRTDAPAPPPARKTRTSAPRGPLGDVAIGAGFAIAGFDSAFAMRSRYCTAIWEHSDRLRRASGALFHAPCGDGLLLSMARDVNPRLRLTGIEPDPDLAERARRRLPEHGRNLTAAAWPSEAGLATLAASDLAIIDPESLVGRPDLASRLRSVTAPIIFVGNDRALARFGTLDALARAAGFELATANPVAAAAVAIPMPSMMTRRSE